MEKAIITVAVGNRLDVGKAEGDLIGTSFPAKLDRWQSAFSLHSPDAKRFIYTDWPPGCPPHLERPYAFKAYAINDVLLKHKPRYILWADSSVVAIRNLSPLWELIARQGYWFSDNYTNNCGSWTCDSALEPLGITREESFNIPQIAATSFGLDMESKKGKIFFDEYFRLAQGNAFCGPWVNDGNSDPRVVGHRHDQSAASVIVWRNNLKMTRQPNIFSDYQGDSDSTILNVHR